ncbi:MULTISPECIES: adenosylmethionine--8-amino-7-oxononanoate transaminase [Methylosinus]|uniref:Adenosylmethionine-8-amino-7-oxononanoate aminotransferase n=1 Tax=Methylosinus trichosporium (strain ATCC 35070 / NCIMB 11131 / UNIQEM 75 / OB3b) TaxID=595536 RepID=A0A2D2CVQ5_METT3|nr:MULTISPECIES: adenosylmethionine--8-amino-7-oxononanoate transaminase [Methylosinus]ATQ66775.1 adenosylmethionine--8-amino-7-oxononanoate aminotransferase BioA [Methylosinus trichosporium OB3b]OBS50390.1 adenosylmethionine--8-amino-7-oxononanoate transaminase [Methylosinus sp. 3S-1]
MTVSRSSPIWRPFTQHALQKDAILVARGEGAWLETADGRRILDAISSWWVITHGHRHPRIVQAIKDQADRLDQLIFAGFTHEPAELLARRLVALTPAGLDHVFYSDSGSTSVEVAIKMALGFFRNRGERRARVLALEHGYHGDTIGAMSTGARSVFNAAYEPLLFDVTRIPFPRGVGQATLDALEAACRSGDAAAFVVEPLVLGAGGMLVYGADILREMKRICAAHGVLFVADEVMTGFGRTGTLFACEQAGVVPDIACYAKGITGGSLPLAVTMCRAEIFDAHYSTDRARTFFHSSSFTANPIACAAALANLDIWESEDVRGRVTRLCAMQEERLARFANDARFSDMRRIGTIAALDLRVADSGYLATIGPTLHEFFVARGLLLRPLGNTIYVLPPYCVEGHELDAIYDAIAEAADRYA